MHRTLALNPQICYYISMSHFMTKLESLVTKALDGIEDKIASLQPMRTLALYERSYDRLFNKFERLPPQSFFTQDKAREIYTALEDGHDEASACAIAMIPQHIVKKWLALGRKGVEPFQEFYLRFERSIALGSHASMEMMKQGDPVAWAQFHLNKGRPSRHYKEQPKKIVVEAKPQQVRVLTDEEKAAKIRALLGGNPAIEGKVVED